MILKTKDFRRVIDTILLAVSVDSGASMLELDLRDGFLYLNVTNSEFYVSTKFEAPEGVEDRAVVEAKLFLSLVSGITTEEFELLIGDKVTIKAGKSKYDLPLIFDNDGLAVLNPIFIENPTVEMNVSNSALSSILNINSKEVQRALKSTKADEVQRMYHIDEHGCFTYFGTMCMNHFVLEKPVTLLLNDRIVRLFKLFKGDAAFSYGNDSVNGKVQTKIALHDDEVYMAALITNDEVLLNRAQGPYTAEKQLVELKYPNHLVVSSNEMSAAISRLLVFVKNSVEKANMAEQPMVIKLLGNEISIYDSNDNVEIITAGAGSLIEDEYTMKVNVVDLKTIFDSCADEFVTMNCGNHRSVVISSGTVDHIIPEYLTKQA